MVAYAACAGAWGSPESSGSKTWGNWGVARCLAERIAQYWKRPFLELLRARTGSYEVNDELGLRRLSVWLTTAQCTEYLNRWVKKKKKKSARA